MAPEIEVLRVYRSHDEAGQYRKGTFATTDEVEDETTLLPFTIVAAMEKDHSTKTFALPEYALANKTRVRAESGVDGTVGLSPRLLRMSMVPTCG